MNKREYNSERRRKPDSHDDNLSIYQLNKREYNSERRRKLWSLLLPIILASSNKREYNSERRRKRTDCFFCESRDWRIRENITPRGDGNSKRGVESVILKSQIRENITPRGDGNFEVCSSFDIQAFSNKREYNSERRRKPIVTFSKNPDLK